MTDPYVEDEINLRDYWRVLVRRRFFIVSIVFAGAVFAVIYTLLQPPIYQSRATLMPLGKTTDGLNAALGKLGSLVPMQFGFGGGDKPADRLLVILESRTLAEKVIERLNLLPLLFAKMWDDDKQKWLTNDPPSLQRGVRALNGCVDISLDKKNRVIRITVEHTDPELVVRIANAYIDALQQILNENTFSLVKKNRLFIETQLRSTRQSLTAAEEALRSFEKKHGIVSLDAQTAASVFSLSQGPEIKLQYVRLRREVNLQDKLFTLLAGQLEQAKIEEAQDETAFQILDKPILPEQRIKPKRRQTVMLATIASAFLGVFLAFFREYFDTTVGNKEQVEQQTGLPVLSVLPSSISTRRQRRRHTHTNGSRLQLTQGLELSRLEALRYLYLRLKHLDESKGLKSLLFTSPDSDEGFSKTLLEFATVIAYDGVKVLLIDGNTRQPTLHQLLSCPLSPGLTELLADQYGDLKAFQPTGIDNLHLLSAGTVTQENCIDLGGLAIESVLSRAKETYDVIFCIAPPILDYNEALVLGSKLDAVCLLLTAGHTELAAISDAQTRLETVKARVIGAILQ